MRYYEKLVWISYLLLSKRGFLFFPLFAVIPKYKHDYYNLCVSLFNNDCTTYSCDNILSQACTTLCEAAHNSVRLDISQLVPSTHSQQNSISIFCTLEQFDLVATAASLVADQHSTLCVARALSNLMHFPNWVDTKLKYCADMQSRERQIEL